MPTTILDVIGFEPVYISESDGTLLLRLDTDQDGHVELIVDSALVTDLALALINAVAARFEKARFAGEVAK